MERAVNYCRCSTEEESQRDALKIQTLESREWIRKMGWLHVDEYVEAKSGTQMKGRSEYQRLFDDMEKDKFDIIVIKDQDRLMRNTKDWYLFLDRMLLNGKRLFIYLDQKYYTPDDALITGIRAIMAEEYSRHLSKKINNAHRGRQEKGTAVDMNSNTYGFIKKRKQPPVIHEQEAEAIRRMYDLSIEGYGANLISKQLWKEGYTDRQGRQFPEARIRKIIRNPLYMGTAVMNKRHFDFETKKTIVNPKDKWIYHEHMVPAIISSEKWLEANKAMDQRKRRESGANSVTRWHPLSHRIVCGICGSSYYRTSRKKKAGIVKEWKCSAYLRNGKKRENQMVYEGIIQCDNIALDEEILMQRLDTLRKQYYTIDGRQNVIESILTVLNQALEEQAVENGQEEKNRKLEKQIEKVERQLDVLLDKLLNEIISDEQYQLKQAELENKVLLLKRELTIQSEQAEKKKKQEQRIAEIRSWLENGGLEKASTFDMIADIKKIIVYPEYLDIELIPKEIKDLSLGEDMPVHIKTAYPFSWTTERGRRMTEEKMLEHWKENPKLTVKQMAALLNVPHKAVLGRTQHLKELGRLRYIGKGGCGYWDIL